MNKIFCLSFVIQIYLLFDAHLLWAQRNIVAPTGVVMDIYDLKLDKETNGYFLMNSGSIEKDVSDYSKFYINKEKSSNDSTVKKIQKSILNSIENYSFSKTKGNYFTLTTQFVLNALFSNLNITGNNTNVLKSLNYTSLFLPLHASSTIEKEKLAKIAKLQKVQFVVSIPILRIEKKNDYYATTLQIVVYDHAVNDITYNEEIYVESISYFNGRKQYYFNTPVKSFIAALMIGMGQIYNKIEVSTDKQVLDYFTRGYSSVIDKELISYKSLAFENSSTYPGCTGLLLSPESIYSKIDCPQGVGFSLAVKSNLGVVSDTLEIELPILGRYTFTRILPPYTGSIIYHQKYRHKWYSYSTDVSIYSNNINEAKRIFINIPLLRNIALIQNDNLQINRDHQFFQIIKQADDSLLFSATGKSFKGHSGTVAFSVADSITEYYTSSIKKAVSITFRNLFNSYTKEEGSKIDSISTSSFWSAVVCDSTAANFLGTFKCDMRNGQYSYRYFFYSKNDTNTLYEWRQVVPQYFNYRDSEFFGRANAMYYLEQLVAKRWKHKLQYLDSTFWREKVLRNNNKEQFLFLKPVYTKP